MAPPDIYSRAQSRNELSRQASQSPSGADQQSEPGTGMASSFGPFVTAAMLPEEQYDNQKLPFANAPSTGPFAATAMVPEVPRVSTASDIVAGVVEEAAANLPGTQYFPVSLEEYDIFITLNGPGIPEQLATTPPQLSNLPPILTNPLYPAYAQIKSEPCAPQHIFAAAPYPLPQLPAMPCKLTVKPEAIAPGATSFTPYEQFVSVTAMRHKRRYAKRNMYGNPAESHHFAQKRVRERFNEGIQSVNTLFGKRHPLTGISLRTATDSIIAAVDVIKFQKQQYKMMVELLQQQYCGAAQQPEQQLPQPSMR
jgi:hypothetical protein